MIYIGQGVGLNSPIFWRRGEPPCVSSPYTCGGRRAIKSESSQFSTGSGWVDPRRYPDYAERAHAVMSREGGLLQVWVLGFC